MRTNRNEGLGKTPPMGTERYRRFMRELMRRRGSKHFRRFTVRSDDSIGIVRETARGIYVSRQRARYETLLTWHVIRTALLHHDIRRKLR